jgi:hypothetical protein
MDLVAMDLQEKRRKMKLTVLHRAGGEWYPDETGRMVNGLMTEARQHPKHPEYVVLIGDFTKEETLKALGGGLAYTVTQVTGTQNEKLPFSIGF